MRSGKKIFVTLAAIVAAAAVLLLTWPAPGIYLGHSTTSVRVQVPGAGERDQSLLLCRYFSVGGYRVLQKWPADTPAGTLLLPDGERALTDGQDCPMPWPWSEREAD